MGRPTTKKDLLTVANANYEKLNELITEVTEKELSVPFDFSNDAKKKEMCIRDSTNSISIYSLYTKSL